MTIRWGSLIADPDGEIRAVRVGHLLSWVACVVAIVLLVLDAFEVVPNSGAVQTSVWAGMVPITGYGVGEAVAGRLQSRKIVTGELPGRRATDATDVQS